MHSHPLAYLLPLGEHDRVPQIPTPQRLFGVFPELVLFRPLRVGRIGRGRAGLEGWSVWVC